MPHHVICVSSHDTGTYEMSNTRSVLSEWVTISLSAHLVPGVFEIIIMFFCLWEKWSNLVNFTSLNGQVLSLTAGLLTLQGDQVSVMQTK